VRESSLSSGDSVVLIALRRALQRKGKSVFFFRRFGKDDVLNQLAQ
jgi:hypothetical protein